MGKRRVGYGDLQVKFTYFISNSFASCVALRGLVAVLEYLILRKFFCVMSE